MKKIISIILVAALLLSGTAVSAFAAQTKTECGGNCDDCPTVIIPGIGQSNVWLLNDDGSYALDEDGDKINCFPAYAPVMPLVKIALVPLLLSLLFQRDIGLSDALAEAVDLCFSMNMSDGNGVCIGNVEVEKYPYSLAECSAAEKEHIYGCIPLRDYLGDYNEDHLYFFSYNSFGNNISTVNELYDFIQFVKKETGHDKVNIVPISLGGTLANGLLEYYGESNPDGKNVYNDLNKVLYIVPALDGSSIVGDVYTKELTFLDKDYLYNGFLEELMAEDEARLIENVLRVFPDHVLMSVLNNTVDALIEDVLKNCTTMWALIPSENYRWAAAKWLGGAENDEIRSQTERYYQAQLNSDANILKLLDYGIKVYNLVEYDEVLYNVGKSWNIENSDGIIDLDSTSMGAYAANTGDTLPDGYVQQNTHCSNPTHNHISPDNVVDASTGLLPDVTFYFDGQNHESTGSNDIIVRLATKILATDDIETVYSDPNFPQFNVGRNTKKLIRSIIPDAKAVDQSKLSAQDAAALNAAIAEAERVIASTVGVAGEAEAARDQLTAVLRQIGVYSPESEKEEPSDAMKKLSLWLYENYGTAGYIQMPLISVQNLFGVIADAFGKLFAIV